MRMILYAAGFIAGFGVGFWLYEPFCNWMARRRGYTRVVQYRSQTRKPAPAPGSDEAGA